MTWQQYCVLSRNSHTSGGKNMFPAKKDITGKLISIAVKNYQKVIKNIQEKRMQKNRIQLQAALMSGSIRRIK